MLGPQTDVRAVIFKNTGDSTFLSAIQRHCPRPMDSRYCPRLADVHRTRTRAGALANWSMRRIHQLVERHDTHGTVVKKKIKKTLDKWSAMCYNSLDALRRPTTLIR